jgi:hypothetical protein
MTKFSLRKTALLLEFFVLVYVNISVAISQDAHRVISHMGNCQKLIAATPLEAYHLVHRLFLRLNFVIISVFYLVFQIYKNQTIIVHYYIIAARNIALVKVNGFVRYLEALIVLVVPQPTEGSKMEIYEEILVN